MCVFECNQTITNAKKEKPKVIIAGASAYSREWDYKKLREIADATGAFLMCDMAHPAGLIAKGLLAGDLWWD